MTSIPPPPRALRLLAVIGALVVGAAVLAPASSSAQTPIADARAQRAAVRAQRAAVASDVNALTGDQSQVESSLATIDANVAGQQAQADDAQRAAATAAGEAQRLDAEADATSARIDDLRAKVAAYAVEAYLNPPGDELLSRFEAASAQTDATKRAFLEMQSAQSADVVDQLRAAQQRLRDQREAARRMADEATRRQAQAESALQSLAAARAQQQSYADQVRARLDGRLAEAAVLQHEDARLAQRIRDQEAALAAAVAKVAPTPPPAGGSGTGGSSPAGPGQGGGTSSPPRPTGPPPPLRTVGGITVNAAIADQLRGLLAAAAADGITLGGSGYRSTASQIALRRQNCGTSDYAIYDMPPDQCSPPTARPGSSMHEQGLAIDFTYEGSFIDSHSSPAYLWMAANAARFGFANLPSEPWHWSTTGR